MIVFSPIFNTIKLFLKLKYLAIFHKKSLYLLGIDTGFLKQEKAISFFRKNNNDPNDVFNFQHSVNLNKIKEIQS